jgi:hypothetical protein
MLANGGTMIFGVSIVRMLCSRTVRTFSVPAPLIFSLHLPLILGWILYYIYYVALMVHSKSSLSPLPDETYEVRVLLEEHNKRMARNEYNPESGLLPHMPSPLANEKRAPPGLGDGLADFASDPSGQKYVGVVQLLKSVPAFQGNFRPFCKPSQDGAGFMYRFAVALADESTHVMAIVSDSVGEKIIGMPASVAVGSRRKRDDVAIFDSDTPWMARLQSIEIPEGGRFFVLTGLSEA